MSRSSVASSAKDGPVSHETRKSSTTEAHFQTTAHVSLRIKTSEALMPQITLNLLLPSYTFERLLAFQKKFLHTTIVVPWRLQYDNLDDIHF